MYIKGKIPNEDLIKVYGDEILNTLFRSNSSIRELKSRVKLLTVITVITVFVQILLAVIVIILLL